MSRMLGFVSAISLTPVPPHPTLSPEERAKYPARYDQSWRFDIPNDGPGTFSSGERVGEGGMGHSRIDTILP
jgi:hypothetical protein